MSTEPVATSSAPAAGEPFRFEELPLVACVETDRFCERCGYNLRTQAVRRDPRTEILLCRCPECGRFHPAAETATAANVWLRRLATLLLFLWIAIIGGSVFGIGMAQGGITFLTLEELTQSQEIRVRVPTQRGSVRTVTRYTRVPRPDYLDWKLLYAVCGGTSLGLGLFAGVAVVVVFHHWRRWACTAVMVGWPALVVPFTMICWWAEAPTLVRWGLPYFIGHMLVCTLGGIAGVAIGRPLARLLVRICLPPRVRPVLAFLWLADGKSPPSGAAGK